MKFFHIKARFHSTKSFKRVEKPLSNIGLSKTSDEVSHGHSLAAQILRPTESVDIIQ
jgi:hypothetical protein